MTRDEVLDDYLGNFNDLLEKKEQSNAHRVLSESARYLDDAMLQLVKAAYFYKGLNRVNQLLEDAAMALYCAVQRGEVVFDPAPGLESSKEWG